jgi:hypothetical protein
MGVRWIFSRLPQRLVKENSLSRLLKMRLKFRMVAMKLPETRKYLMERGRMRFPL